MKKTIALLLAIMMVIGMFAGCGETKAPAETKAPVAEQPADDKTPAETDAPAVETLEEYDLVYYMAGDPQVDEELVEQAINDYLRDTLNINLDIVMIPFGDLEEKFRVAVGSGEQVDVVFTSSWANDFYGNITRNALLPLNDLLPTYGADILAQLPDCWGSVTMNGNIYAVPNEQIWPYQSCLIVDTATLEEYGWDISNIKNHADLTPMLAEYKAANPDSAPLYAGTETSLSDVLTWNGIESVGGSAGMAQVAIDDETCTVLNPWEFPSWEEKQVLYKEWYDAGYVRSDIATLGGTDPMDMATGKSIMRTDGTYKPGIKANYDTKYEKDMTVVPVGMPNPIMLGDSIIATNLAIPVTSKDPARAMMFINAMNTDPVLYNLLCFGIEGTHYTLDGNCATTVENSGWNPNADWAYGCQFNAYTRPGQDADVWDQTRAINAAGVPTVLMGFIFNPEPVKNEIAAVSAAAGEYNGMLGFSPKNTAELRAQYIEAMKAAGAEVIKAEVQKQVNEWLAANGK